MIKKIYPLETFQNHSPKHISREKKTLNSIKKKAKK